MVVMEFSYLTCVFQVVRPFLGTTIMVICQGQCQISMSHFSKNGTCKGIYVSQTNLVLHVEKVLFKIICNRKSFSVYT